MEVMVDFFEKGEVYERGVFNGFVLVVEVDCVVDDDGGDLKLYGGKGGRTYAGVEAYV